MYILGISAFYHDSASALIKEGVILAAVQEERFSRIKGDSSFPSRAISYCLSSAGITIEEVDHIVFYDKPVLKFDRILASYIHTAPKGIRSFLKAVPAWLKDKLWVESTIRNELGLKDSSKLILFTEHHQSHAASAFLPSPYEKAAILTVDGAGEWTTTMIGKGDGNSIKMMKKISFPHSIGLLYSAFTYYCGFRVNSGEYKLMGLAPYGRPVYLDLIKRELVNVSEDGSFLLNERYFGYISGLRMINRRFEKLFGRPALKADMVPDQFYMDVASSVQELISEILVKMASYARRLTGESNLCIAGGVGLNCVSNRRILKESGYDSIWVQPASGDAGGSLGAAMYAYYCYLNKSRSADGVHDFQKGSYLGPDYTDDDIKSALDSFKAVYRRMELQEVYEETARLIDSQKVVGWFQGRSEFGPRALGNRSILGDARSTEMQSVMNLKIKFRESFRPFAPSILEEHVSDYFDINSPSPYMLFTAGVIKDKLVDADCTGKTWIELLKVRRSVIPAVTHVDGSARIQTVSEKENPVFYGLLKEFYKLTGCPVLINTSFNVRGEPVVNSPADAYMCFMGTHIDVLVMGNYILFKDEQPVNRGIEEWKKSHIKD